MNVISPRLQVLTADFAMQEVRYKKSDTCTLTGWRRCRTLAVWSGGVQGRKGVVIVTFYTCVYFSVLYVGSSGMQPVCDGMDMCMQLDLVFAYVYG